MNEQTLDLYLDAEGGGLCAGALAGGAGLRGGLEQSFEDRLRIHFGGRLRGGSLSRGARHEGGGEAVFLCAAAAGARGVTEPQ